MLKKRLICLFAACALLTGCSSVDIRNEQTITTIENITEKNEDNIVPDVPSSLNYEYVKAIWLSQFDMLSVYTDGNKQRNKRDYTQLVKNIINNVKALGFNTVFIQLRPNGDSIYPSELFPPSRYACGSYSSHFDYDAFAIFLSLAREAELSVHGWINPFRCMSEKEITELDSKYTIKKWYDESHPALKAVNGNYYLDPSYSETRKLICDGAAEILVKYELDGIHIDDYFYPTTSEDFDKPEYLKYRNNNGTLSLADFRRQNVNELIKSLYKTVKHYRKDALFGVSPSGNNARNYDVLYADTEKWCKASGYIDYICPQVYFGFEHGTCDFKKVCEEFSSMIKRKDIKLIIGMSLGKAISASDGGEDIYAGKGAREWIQNKDILLRMLEYTKTLDKCGGVSYFSYQYFYDAATNKLNPKASEEKAKLLPAFKSFQ